MKVFITHTFKGAENKAEIEHLCGLVRQAGFEDYSFVRDAENYQKGFFATPADLMKAAREAIHSSDALLIDMTEPSIGKGIEAGVAFERGMPIIVLKHREAENRNTVRGLASIVIEYDNISEIVTPLKEYYLKITSSK